MVGIENLDFNESGLYTVVLKQVLAIVPLYRRRDVVAADERMSEF